MLIDKIKATVANKVAVLKDINGNKIIPMTLTKAVQDDTGKKLNVILEEKMGKADVVNVNTQVESDGKALNAVQLNPNVDGTLANKVEVLNNDRGYLNIKHLTNTDMNTVIKTGKYYFGSYPTLGNTNCPRQGEDIAFAMEVNSFLDNDKPLVSQVAYQIYPSSTNVYIRTNTNDVWTEWQQIATTTGLMLGTLNGYYNAWTTETDNVIRVETSGNIVHVRALIETNNSVADLKINSTALPRPHKDWWVVCNILNSANTFNVYFGWDGNLYCKTGAFTGIFQIDFCYRLG